MNQYRKKPVVIEAVQWNGTNNFDEVMKFMQENHGHKVSYEDAEELAYKTKQLSIRTLEGTMTASENDWIIKGVNGEFYPCKPDIFAKTYEPATPSPSTVKEEDIRKELLQIVDDAYCKDEMSYRVYDLLLNTIQQKIQKPSIQYKEEATSISDLQKEAEREFPYPFEPMTHNGQSFINAQRAAYIKGRQISMEEKRRIAEEAFEAGMRHENNIDPKSGLRVSQHIPDRKTYLNTKYPLPE